VIGNGNVSLDVARILCRDVSELSQTDIADHALEVLAQSAVRELVVCGRRGPAEAAFTAAELKELIRLPGVTVCAQTDASDAPTGESTAGPNGELLHGLASTATPAAPRTIEFRFLRSPVAIRGAGRVEEVELAVNELVPGEHGMRVRDTGQRERISCGLVVTSIGYRGRGLAGVPFDAQTGRIPNEAGRVLTADGHASGEYCAGWIKRGPSGVIGTNKQCATETVSSLLTDLAAGSLAPRTDHDEDSITAVLSTRGVTVVDQPAWLRVDAHEKAQGQRSARPRVKLCRRSQLLDRAHGEREPAPAVTV
jgi:ferredoxin/flavodoxin---NADP+ reductase